MNVERRDAALRSGLTDPLRDRAAPGAGRPVGESLHGSRRSPGHRSHQKGDAMATRSARWFHVATRVVAALALLTVLIPSLTAVSAAQKTTGNNVLRVRMPWWPDTLDPQ